MANLPYHHKRKISVYRSAQDAVVETDFGVTVTYDWQSRVTVVVPGTYADALCGLCGNYNGDTSDDMMMKDGQTTLNPDALGQSWKVADVPGCMELSKEQCPTLLEATRQQKVTEKGCGLISKVDGPFTACHALVDPFTYVQNCVHDFCLFPDQEAVVCQQISHYAATCQAAGITIGNWRTDDFCSKLGQLKHFFASQRVVSIKGSPGPGKNPCGDEPEVSLGVLPHPKSGLDPLLLSTANAHPHPAINDLVPINTKLLAKMKVEANCLRCLEVKNL